MGKCYIVKYIHPVTNVQYYFRCFEDGKPRGYSFRSMSCSPEFKSFSAAYDVAFRLSKLGYRSSILYCIT